MLIGRWCLLVPKVFSFLPAKTSSYTKRRSIRDQLTALQHQNIQPARPLYLQQLHHHASNNVTNLLPFFQMSEIYIPLHPSHLVLHQSHPTESSFLHQNLDNSIKRVLKSLLPLANTNCLTKSFSQEFTSLFFFLCFP